MLPGHNILSNTDKAKKLAMSNMISKGIDVNGGLICKVKCKANKKPLTEEKEEKEE